MIKAMFNGITPVAESMISYNNMSESELADELRRLSLIKTELESAPPLPQVGGIISETEWLEFEKRRKFMDFYCGSDISNSYFMIRVYFSGFEKRNGISFATYSIKNSDTTTADFMFHTLKAIYPYEMAEYIVKDSISAINTSATATLSTPGTHEFVQHNIVQAHGKYKWFSGRLPSDMREFNPNVTYFLLDNHPAMPEEMFSSSSYVVWNLTDMGVAGDDIQEREFRRKEGFYGRGYREDFFTFTEIPDAVKAKIGMKTICDSVDYNFITISPKAREMDGVPKQPLEKCTNNPYGTYGKLK
ncbi:hypothetical protein DSECCO2_519950 [anaerobic digester metagenome]